MFRFSALMMHFNDRIGGFKYKHAYRLLIITEIALVGQTCIFFKVMKQSMIKETSCNSCKT